MSFGLKENINTAGYWDRVFTREIKNNKWRRNVLTFGKIRTYLGLRVTAGDHVLDIGCGYGVLLNKLKGLDCRLTGWDISEVAVQEVLRFRNKARCVDFNDYEPNARELFDHVVSTEFLEHFENPELVFDKMYRMARKSVIIAVPNNCMKDCREHMAVFNIRSMRAMVENYPHRNLSIENFLEEFVYKDDFGNDMLSSRPTLLMIMEKK